MISENSSTNGVNVNVNYFGDDIFFDARVHRVCTPHSDVDITILLRHNGQFIEALLKPDMADVASLKVARNLTAESLVRVTSLAVPESQPVKEGTVSEVKKVRISKLVLLSDAVPNLPGRLKFHGAPGEELPLQDSLAGLIDERLDNRLLDARVASTAAIFKIFSGIHELAVERLAALDFYRISTPAFISYEYPGEEDDHFSVPYFDKTAWLAPTSEVHLGMALAADLERVYDIHTVFRREREVDRRHLTEFTMLELVFALRHDWTEILDLADNLMVFLIRSLQEREKYKALTLAAQRLYPSAGSFKLGLDINGKLIRVKFKEAKAILRDSLGWDSNDQDDFTREEEAELGRFLSSKKSPLGPPTDVFIITHYPRHLRACNVYPSNEDATTHSFDVILRGQEIVTGCQLIHSHKELRSAYTTRTPPMDPDSPGWRPYIAAHEIGMPPWGGFGLGINRFVQGFLGLADIRESILFPRNATRLAP